MNAVSTYRLYASNLSVSLKAISERPQVARETEYYLANIGNVESVEDFVADTRLFRYAMQAHGLGDMLYARALISKVLEEGIDSPDALANRLTDTRFRELAEDFNFARYGTATTSFTRTQDGTVEKYVRQFLEVEAGSQSEGARLALYFERKATSIETPLDILGDSALLKVIQTAFGMPLQMSLSSIDKQVEMIEERLNVSDLQDPQNVEELIERFNLFWDAQNPAAVTVPTVLTSQRNISALSTSILVSIQNLKI